MDNELYDVEDKSTKSKFIMGTSITTKFIVLTYGNDDKVHIRADKILLISKTSRGTTCIYLDGDNAPIFVKESVDEIYAKISKTY